MRKRKKALTPSLPQHVRFPGWKIHEGSCKQRIFSPVNTCLQCYAFWWKSFYIIMPVRKRRQKSWRVSNFALLFVVLKWHHGTFIGFSEWHAGKHGSESSKFTYSSCVISHSTVSSCCQSGEIQTSQAAYDHVWKDSSLLFCLHTADHLATLHIISIINAVF